MSKIRFIGVSAVLAVLMVFVTGCSADPVAVGQQFQEAVNSGEVESALELLSEDAVLLVGDAPPRTGKAEIGDWLEIQSELNFRIEGAPIASGSGVTYQGCSISSDVWSYFRANPMTGTCEVALDGGAITGFTIRFDEDSMSMLSDSPAAASGDLIAVWTAEGVIPRENPETHPEAGDWATFYLQFAEGGKARLALSPEDLVTSPDPSHPGANFSWTYDDFVLTVRNDGAASEGYCQEGDLGSYMVKKVDDGGIQFKPVQDACSWRKYSFQRVGSSWDPYVP